MPLRDWKAALTRSTIQFEERMLEPQYSRPVYTKFGTPSLPKVDRRFSLLAYAVTKITRPTMPCQPLELLAASG
jgi:hypothetical protein